MKFIIKREQLLVPLQQVCRQIILSRPKLPILNNLLLQVTENTLILISNDLGLEIIAKVKLNQSGDNGAVTVSARKFFNIWRKLSDNNLEIKVLLEKERLHLYAGHSHFVLATISAHNFPKLENLQSAIEFEIPQKKLIRLIESTHFSMAYQDVRYYLNGMLFEIEGKHLRTVATDGHRLAICSIDIDKCLPTHSVIIPRKGVVEFLRLLNSNSNNSSSNSEHLLKLQITTNNIRAYVGNFILTSKLIDGSFPDYRNVLPKNPNKILTADLEKLKQGFSRAEILLNEKYKGVRLNINANKLIITTNNLEQEESNEIIDVDYSFPMIDICFNVNYILDVLNVLKCKKVSFLLTDSNSSVQIVDVSNTTALYIIMPIRR